MKLASPNQFNAQIYSEASEWLVEFRSGDIDADARKAFYTWLRTSPQHMRAYLELASIWNEGSSLDPHHRFDLEEIAQDGNVIPLTGLELSNVGTAQPVNDSGAGTTTTMSVASSNERPIAGATRHMLMRRSRRPRIWAAGVAVLLATFGFWIYIGRDTYATSIGEQRSLTLADGSTVELNTHSRIRVRFTIHRREIDLLQGQALFHVAKDRARPFVVQSDNTAVRAVGTEFDVYRKLSGTTVTVVEGRVAVLPWPSASQPDAGQSSAESGSASTEGAAVRSSVASVRAVTSVSKVPDAGLIRKGNPENPAAGLNAGPARAGGEHLDPEGPTVNDGEFLLRAGEQAILTAKATLKSEAPDVVAATAWTQRRLIFQSATLSTVVEEFNRYNSRQIVVSDPRLADFHITGIFASTDPSSLVRFMQRRPDVAVTEENDRILIAQKIR